MTLGLIAATDSAWWLIALALFVYGVGVGFATAQVTNVVLVDVPAESAGQGSGIRPAARELGSALGIAVLTTLFLSTLNSGLRDRLADLGIEEDEAAGVADAAREAMTSGLAICGYVCAALLVPALAATVFVAPRDAEPSRPGEAKGREPAPR
ncbi:hypothetical protein ACFT9I_28785 [Streptomyces sp. NPDC057137]|uniref:hypothetical protein n=1 Tax=Streptomyces sp. NPDC057137 TaxID=3346030 RepID=UPI00362EBEC9